MHKAYDQIIEKTTEKEQKGIHEIVKEMKAREAQARMFLHIEAALKSKNYSSVNKKGISRDM